MASPKTSPARVNLRQLEYSPTRNPLLDGLELEIRRRTVAVKNTGSVISAETGEVVGMSVIRITEEKDDAGFVKVFAEGVRAAFALTRTAYRVFQAVLDAYQRTSMSGGYAESVRLYFFDGGLDGVKLGMSEKTFQRGLKELLEKGFLAGRTPSEYWVNPGLFFRGDRVAFLREYRRREANDSRSKVSLTGEVTSNGMSAGYILGAKKEL